MVYFFSFAGGSLAWALGGVTWVHPFQCWWLQLIGSALLLACALGFVAVHVNLGANWSPEADQKAVHHLVTHGTFAWARHPMYAIFLWASVGTLLSTLNWLVAWIVTGLVFVTLRRIETEERILISLFGAEYLEYMRTVSALGPPWAASALIAARTPRTITPMMFRLAHTPSPTLSLKADTLDADGALARAVDRRASRSATGRAPSCRRTRGSSPTSRRASPPGASAR